MLMIISDPDYGPPISKVGILYTCLMFEGPEYPAPLSNDTVRVWLTEAVSNELSFLAIVWDDVMREYNPFMIGTPEELLLCVLSHQNVHEHPSEELVAILDVNSGESINPDDLMTEG